MNRTNISLLFIFALVISSLQPIHALVVTGQITNLASGLPVPDHPVFVLVDEGGQGFNYFGKVSTDSNGIYADTFFVPPGPQLTLKVLTFDCNMVPHEQIFNITQQQYTVNFLLCGGLTGCHAWFSAKSYHGNPLRITFHNYSVGDINTFHWDFGDGNTSSLGTPIHLYTQPGTYIVHLTVSHSNTGFNCFDTYTDTIVVGVSPPPCQADFDAWANMANPMKWHFKQQSSGNIIQYRWDFGDGSTAMGQNSMHVYTDTGLYQVCLMVTGPLCQDTTCRWIQVVSPGTYHMAGQVFAGLFPAQNAEVLLFRKMEGKYYLVQTTLTDSLGVYYFYQLLGGQYMLLSYLQASSPHHGDYIPTYHPSTPFWSKAGEIGLYSNRFNVHVNLKPYPINQPGPGQLSGKISYAEKQNHGGPAADVEVLIMDMTGQLLGITWSQADGSFDFPGIKYGKYQVHAEVPGIPTQVALAELNAAQPMVDNISLEIHPMLILPVAPKEAADGARIRAFPNPARDALHLEINLSESTPLQIRFLRYDGQSYMHEMRSHPGDQQVHTLQVSSLPTGIYVLKIDLPDGRFYSQKVVILR